MTSVSQTIDYTKKQYMHSSYRWMKLTPVGGSGQTATLSTTSSTIVNFEIPNNVVNLSQSKLAFDMLLTAAASTHCVDALSLSLFDRITLSTRSGVVLANCDNMGQFTHLISKLKTKSSNLVDNANNITTSPQLASGVISAPLSSFPCLTPTNTTVKLGQKKPMGDICKSGSCCFQSIGKSITTSGITQPADALQSLVNNVSNVYRIDGSVISTPFLENLHVITENKVAAAAGALAISYQLPLGSIKDTLLEINKSLYFGDNLILSLSFNPATKFSWLTTGGVEGGQASIAAGLIGGVLGTANPGTQMVQWTPTTGTSPQTVQPALSNLALYIAVETDPIITSQLINKVNTEGFSITVPYVYCTKTLISITAAAAGTIGSGSFAMQQRITRGYGQRLLRCYTAVFGTETLVAANTNHCVYSGTFNDTVADGTTAVVGVATTAFTTNLHDDMPLGAYNTSLDGIRLQDFTLSASDSTHWLVNEPYLRGSCILNAEQYKNQCMHIDSWTGNPVCEEDDTIDNGISLDADKTYGVSYNTLYNFGAIANKNHYLFFVVQRSLVIKGNQIMLV